jgi:hypothetical protein
MPKLSDLDREIMRRAPNGSAWRLAPLFRVSVAYVRKIQNGTRGLPGLNGLGMRPELLKSRAGLDKWRTTQHERVEATYRRGLECIEKNEALSVAIEKIDASFGLFKGAVTLKPRMPTTASRPPVAAVPTVPSKTGLLYDKRPASFPRFYPRRVKSRG